MDQSAQPSVRRSPATTQSKPLITVGPEHLRTWYDHRELLGLAGESVITADKSEDHVE